jgi:sulfonate transport system substrate-binding protein
VLDTFSQADALTLSQRPQSITLLAKTMGLPEAVIASYLDHRPPTTITPVSSETAARQQQTADLFYENKLVPKKSTSVPASGSPQPHKERNHESEYVLVFTDPR